MFAPLLHLMLHILTEKIEEGKEKSTQKKI